MTDNLIHIQNQLVPVPNLWPDPNKYRLTIVTFTHFFKNLNAAVASVLLRNEPNWTTFK